MYAKRMERIHFPMFLLITVAKGVQTA